MRSVRKERGLLQQYEDKVLCELYTRARTVQDSNMLSCTEQTLREHREEPYIINEIQ